MIAALELVRCVVGADGIVRMLYRERPRVWVLAVRLAA